MCALISHLHTNYIVTMLQ